ncbi:MAG: hypothetical protein ABIO50_11070 [Nitrosospira sp.]
MSNHRATDAASASKDLARATIIERCNIANLKITIESGVGQVNTSEDSATAKR